MFEDHFISSISPPRRSEKVNQNKIDIEITTKLSSNSNLIQKTKIKNFKDYFVIFHFDNENKKEKPLSVEVKIDNKFFNRIAYNYMKVKFIRCGSGID